MLNSPPAAHERDRAIAFVTEQSQVGGEGDATAKRLAAWSSLCQALLASTEFRFLD